MAGRGGRNQGNGRKPRSDSGLDGGASLAMAVGERLQSRGCRPRFIPGIGSPARITSAALHQDWGGALAR